ncbi:hypothetical protein K432DRAFT_410356 [Lepidopterella palustris CBS 459.81]|uniref:Altered inheritance of mitochondria protein 11 n=1 Tax=Lepidopterella palustris CBS 459.81 TaxID=1314670 RepID=A0A8E2DY65_9PEZI|nr:hypothetical protein K432DRAFT_410356 [Lepidopterella palustris CBS 459.81]
MTRPAAEPPNSVTQRPTDSPSLSSHITSPRSRKQLGLFFAGASFLVLSTLVTKRSLVRRHNAIVPKFYQPNTRLDTKVSPTLDAIDALGLATLNVFSFAMMTTGGALWAFDISSMDDMRSKLRVGLGLDDAGRSEKE